MTISLLQKPWLYALLLSSAALSWGHDLTASHVIVRVRAEEIELQTKIASDLAWRLAQEISPGAVFLREDFEAIGRPLLLKVGRTLDELTIDEKIHAPLRTEVVLAEDTFLFITAYARPVSGTVRIKETYLQKISLEYVSHFRLFDKNGVVVNSKTLTEIDPVFEFTVPPKEAAAPAPNSATKTKQAESGAR